MDDYLVDSHADPRLNEQKSNKITCYTIFLYAFLFFTGIFVILLSIICYFAFAAIILLTFYLFLHEWISLFAKKRVDMIFSILVNFSDFGLIFGLFLFCVYIVKQYFRLIKAAFKKILTKYKPEKLNYLAKERNNSQKAKRLYNSMIIMFIIEIVIISLLLWSLTNQFYIFIFTCIFEIIFLLLFFIECFLSYFLNRLTSGPKVDQGELAGSLQLSDTDTLPNNSDTSDLSNANIFKGIKKFLANENVFVIVNLKGMFDNSITGSCCQDHQVIYKIIIILIISALQLYGIVYPFVVGSIDIPQLIVGLLIKIVALYKICSYNFIDIIINGKRVLKSLKKKKALIVFWIVVTLYIAIFVVFLIVFIFSSYLKFPTNDSAEFYENNKKWYKLNQTETILPEAFCYSKAKKGGMLKTDDFAMMTTLPRLYGLTKDGKCFIKPSMRGLFNTTMKYIFGKNYEKDNIQIMCKKIQRYPMLVITSQKILEQTLTHFKDDTNITLLGNQFEKIVNLNYFANQSYKKILDKEGKKLLNEYENCVRNKSVINCEHEWDLFTQYYWPNYFDVEYVDIPGFERYQINIESQIIQPTFITGQGKLCAGTHYIVGGSYEDRWGLAFHIETLGRTYIPLIFDNFVLMYSFVRRLIRNLFFGIEWFNRKLFYYELISLDAMTQITNLFQQFNFTHESLFTVGHSITGTAFKGISYFNDIQGISFEATDGENNGNLKNNDRIDVKMKVFSHMFSQMTNIYSRKRINTGFDRNCDVNGLLPKRYLFPNVYETACLTAITCSETMKYVPLCKQVLTLGGQDPEVEFNKSFDAYLDYYGYKKY